MTASSERIVAVHGQRLNVALDGPNGAPWLVFSNSLATNLHLWDSQIEAFAGRWRVVRYDYRGHGASAPSTDAVCDVSILAADLLAVIDTVGASRVHHVGVSMGSVAGLAAARQAPERFASLVLCNARLRSTESSAADLERRAQLARSHGMEALVVPTLYKWFGGARLPLDDGVRQLVADMIVNTRPADFAAYATGLASYALEDCLADLPVPITLLAGSDDGTIGRVFRALSERHPRTKCLLLDGAGHLPNIQVPAQFNSALAQLLS
jgi:3-oxoadipate enol-lactonase